MEVAKKVDGYTIIKKRSGRYGVRDKSNNWVKGDKKVEVLVKAGLIKAAAKKEAPAEAATEEAAA